MKEGNSSQEEISIKLRESLQKFGLNGMNATQLKETLSSLDGPAPKAIPVSPEYTNQANMFVVTLLSLSGNIIPVGITKEVTLQDSKKNIYWIERSISNAIIQGILLEKPWILYRGEPCLISFYTDSKLLRETITHSKYFLSNCELAEIWIYSLKMPCFRHRNKVETVTAYVKAENNLRMYPLNVYYCSECQKYYINSDQYRIFAEQHGLPAVRLIFERNYNGTIDFSAWREESPLHLLGYNVDSKENLSDEERHQRLLHILSKSNLTKAEIVSFLEFLIHKNKGNIRLDSARSKWRDDAEFIRNYELSKQRKIIGKFKQ